MLIHVLKLYVSDEVESQIALSSFGCNQKETPFVNCLEWAEYQHKDGIWSFKQLKRIVIPHGLDYASVLSPGQSLCLIAREPFGIVYDSAKSVAVPLNSSHLVEGTHFRSYFLLKKISTFIFFFYLKVKRKSPTCGQRTQMK